MTGFSSGAVRIDTLDNPVTDGFQPDGEYEKDVLWQFCCRSDDRLAKPLYLPNKEPFILFQKTFYGCQAVHGRSSYF